MRQAPKVDALEGAVAAGAGGDRSWNALAVDQSAVVVARAEVIVANQRKVRSIYESTRKNDRVDAEKAGAVGAVP